MHLFDLINNQEQYFPTTGILLNTHTIAQDTKKTNMLIKTITIQISKAISRQTGKERRYKKTSKWN